MIPDDPKDVCCGAPTFVRRISEPSQARGPIKTVARLRVTYSWQCAVTKDHRGGWEHFRDELHPDPWPWVARRLEAS